MRLIVQFSERTGIAVPELNEAAKPKLESFTAEMTARMATAAGRMNLSPLLTQIRARFDRRVQNASRDVEIGFIEGRSAIVTEASSTLAAQLEDEPDPVIIRRASRTLPNITERAIGSWSPILAAREADISCANSTGHIMC
jgi:hypothetical protein